MLPPFQLRQAFRRVPAFDPLCACVRPSAAALSAYFAVNEQTDSWHAARLAAMNPAVSIVPVQGARDHSVVALMVADGSFDRLMREVRQACAGGA